MYDTDNWRILPSKQLLVQSHLNSVKAILNVVLLTDFEHVTLCLAIYNALQGLNQNGLNFQRQTKYFHGRNFPRKKFFGDEVYLQNFQFSRESIFADVFSQILSKLNIHENLFSRMMNSKQIFNGNFSDLHKFVHEYYHLKLILARKFE